MRNTDVSAWTFQLHMILEFSYCVWFLFCLPSLMICLSSVCFFVVLECERDRLKCADSFLFGLIDEMSGPVLGLYLFVATYKAIWKAFSQVLCFPNYISNSKNIVDLSRSAQMIGGAFWIFKSILMFVSAPCAKNKQGNVNAGSKGGL